MAHVDQVYNNLVKTLLDEGFHYQDASRANIDMLQIPQYTLDIDINKGFPLLTTKRISWKTIAHELVWMLSGSTNIDYLKENGVKIWDKDAANFKQGTDSYVGRIYGAQWRKWSCGPDRKLDQITKLINNLKDNLHGRRHLVNAWNPAELNQMALPPCHWSFEIMPVSNTGFALKWHQRSCDVFLGIPFDICLYGFMGMLIQFETGLKFERLIGDLSNVHFYGPHIELAKEQISREPFEIPAIFGFNKKASINNLCAADLDIVNYIYHPAIKAEMYAKVNENTTN